VNHHAANFLVNDRIDGLMAEASRGRLAGTASRSSSPRSSWRARIAGALRRGSIRPELGTATRSA
jgi:hypothetical protein